MLKCHYAPTYERKTIPVECVYSFDREIRREEASQLGNYNIIMKQKISVINKTKFC